MRASLKARRAQRGAKAGGGRALSGTVPDALLAELEHLGNCAIHEIVFAKHHASDDQVEEALTCVCQAQMNLERMSKMLVPYDPANPSTGSGQAQGGGK